MPANELLRLIVQADTQGAVRALDRLGSSAKKNLTDAEDRTRRVAGNMQKFGAAAVVSGALVATALYKAGQSAADLEQAVGGTEAVFKDASGTIDDFASNAASKMGLSERAFREATTRFGGSLQGVGFAADAAAEKAIELTGTAADLAATFGGTTAEAVDALAAAMRGEADPAERFNLRLNQTAVNAKAVEMGLADSTSSVDANAKAQATLQLITEQSADAQGQFAREAGTAAGQMQIANAEFENAKAALGQSVAPIMADVAGKLASLSQGFKSANESSGGLLSKLAAYGTIGLIAGGGLSFVVGKLIEMRTNLGPLAGKLVSAEGGLTKLGKVGVVAGVALAGVALNQMGDDMNDLTVDVDSLAKALGNLGEANREELDRFVSGAIALGEFDEAVKQTADTNVVAAERLIDYAEANGLAADEVEKLRGIVDSKRESDVQGAKDQEEYSAQVAAAVAPTKNLTDALEEEDEALQGVLDATLAQFDANLGYRQSVDGVEDSLTDLIETQKEHGSGSEEYRDKLLAAEGALLDQAKAAVRLAEDTATAAGRTLNAKQKSEVYRAELTRLRDSLAPGSPLRAALQGYIDQLGRIPRSVTTQVRPVISGARATRLLTGERASGGPVSAGGTYLVGERGPELLQMGSQSGQVIPNDALTSTRGGDTIVIQVGDRELARLYADGKVRAARRGVGV